MTKRRELILTIPVSEITEPDYILHPNVDLENLEELAQSIKEQGLINPLVVKPHGKGYQLISGYRRWLAAKKFGIENLPCRIMVVNNKTAAMASATENLQRSDQDVVEEGKLYHDLVFNHGLTVSEIGKKVGKSVGYVESRLDLINEPKQIQDYCRTGKLQLGLVPDLKKIKNEQEKIMVAGDIVRRGYKIAEGKYLIKAFQKYSGEMKKVPKKEILEKAREEPIASCAWCKQEKKVRWFRQMVVCDDCYRKLMFLWERDKHKALGEIS